MTNVYIWVAKYLNFFVFGILKFHCDMSSYGFIIFPQEWGQNRLSEKQNLRNLLRPCWTNYTEGYTLGRRKLKSDERIGIQEQ